MPFSSFQKVLSAAVVFVLLGGFVLANFLGQTPQPSPTLSPSPSPTVSPSPSPARAPSPTPLPGAQNFHQWGSVTVFNGLPSDSVRAIAQTHDGVMWFGTDNGLSRFDGRRVQTFSPGPSESDRVLIVEISQSGELWIGTEAGAFVYADNRFSPVSGTQDVGVTSILIGETETYLGTDAGVVYRAVKDGAGGITAVPVLAEPLKGEDGNPLRIGTLIENNGKRFGGTFGRGVFEINNDAVKELPSSPRPLFVSALASTADQILWFGTDAAKGASGVYRLDAGSRATRVPAPTADVFALEANDDGVWAGTERYGLFQFADSKLKKTYTFENTSGGLRSNTIFTLFTDREGVLWIGTNRGVSRFDSRGASQETVSDIPNSNFIRTLFRASDGKIYAGSNRGLFVKKEANWVRVEAYENQPIYGIAEDRSKKLQIFAEQPNKRSFTAADGSVWTLDDRGVVLSQDGRSEKVIDAEDVRDIYVDGDQVWAATTTRGLMHARKNARFGWIASSIGFEQGLPSEKAFSILPLADGLLIATNRGVVTYRPGTIAPKLIATRVLSQRPHDLAELNSTIALDYPQNTLLVEVAGQSSRTFPEEFQYAFVLKNGNGDEVERRLSNEAQYAPADLAPGDYSIESIAFNRDLLPSEPLTIRFSVAKAPFPWMATALGVLLVMALAGLIWAIVEHRRIAQRNRELAAARLDLANEAERERRRIARDLHDQTLADLRNLMITSDRLGGDNREFRAEIEAVSTDIRRICEDLSPSVLENVGLVAALEFLLDRTVENRRFSADESVEERITFPLHVQLQIYRIAQEVLTNIVRHSSATEVEMNVEAAPAGEFSLTIRDNGETFHPDGTQKGRGIANIRSRANLINGKVNWKEARRGGNVFSLKVKSANGNR